MNSFLPREARRLEAVPLDRRILDLCFELTKRPSHAHAEQDGLFAKLDGLLDGASDRTIRAVLGSVRFARVRQRLYSVRSDYEFERERVLARRIIAAGDRSPIDDFRSRAWYDAAHEFEARFLSAYRPRRLLFVGAGPYPTTAMSFMRADPGAAVSCVEIDAEACELARKVAALCGYGGLRVIHADAIDLINFSAFDCVVVGLVVGVSDAEKSDIVRHFKNRVPPSTLLAFRTASGPGRVIYPPVDLSDLEDTGYEVLADPPQKTFSLVLRRPRGASP